jgi:hypothetical protein
MVKECVIHFDGLAVIDGILPEEEICKEVVHMLLRIGPHHSGQVRMVGKLYDVGDFIGNRKV